MSGRILILGGTAEAVALADRLVEVRPELGVTTSLAGATRDPVQPRGTVRRGGFGGPDGLAAVLRDDGVAALVDATHPFAATMARHAVQAAAMTGTPRLKLLRPMWQRQAADRWIEVDDAAGAAAVLRELGVRRVLLTLGRRDLDAFAGLRDVGFTVRMIEPPEQPPPLAQAELLLARGPFTESGERALLDERAIEVLVTKAAGGRATAAKIEAARALGLPVVMIRRPAPPPGAMVENVEAALAWIAAHVPR